MILTAALVLASLAAASPMACCGNGDYPEKSVSRGFHLVVNVTDPSREQSEPLHGNHVSSIHIGPPFHLLGVGNNAKKKRVFYQNATEEEFRSGNAQILSDSGAPVTPYGLSLLLDDGDKEVSTLRLNAGPGQRGVAISQRDHPYAFVNLSGLAVCTESIQYHGGKKMNILKQFNKDIPSRCAPVNLLPQCTELEAVEKEDISSHEFVQKADCYKNVSDINWSRYKPFSWHH